MKDMFKAFDYACNKFYYVIYDRERCGYEQRVEGLLLNYASGNVVLLSDKGMYYIKSKDIVFMRPIEPRMDKLSKEFKELLKYYIDKEVIMEDYELTMGTIEYYKDKACKIAKNRCDKCEAAQEYNGELYCAFDTVNRFIEWNNKYNKEEKVWNVVK